MAAAGDVCAGLIQHKATLLRELCDTNILDVLVKKGLFNLNDLELITGAVDSDKCNYFIELVSKQSGLKLQELCAVLYKECPKLSQELASDRHKYVINGYSTIHSAKENMVMNHNLNRRQRWLEIIGRPDLMNPKTNPKCHFVCCLHFEKYMITCKPILKLDAEPVNFLPNQPHTFIDNSRCYKEVFTQTDDCYLNGLSTTFNENSFPEVPVIKQENVQDESSFQSIAEDNFERTLERIKQEYMENETIPDTTEQENMQTEYTKTLVTPKKSKKQGTPKKRKRKEMKKPEHKEKPYKFNYVVKIKKEQ